MMIPIPIPILVVSFLLADLRAPAILGDVDGDRRIDVADLAALRRALDGVLALPADAKLRADVDRDGLLTEEDYTALTFPALEVPSVPPFQRAASGMPVIESMTPSFAGPGAVVAIDGTGFGAGVTNNEVWLGGVPARILGATPRRLEFVVPNATGTLLVRNVSSGLTSLGAAFITAPTEHPPYDPRAGAGTVYFAGPPRVLVTNETVTVPIVVHSGPAEIGEVGFRIFFDPGHVEVLWLENKLPSAFSALPPCIDNAAGVLGAGAIRLVAPPDDPAGELRVAFEVTFKVLIDADEPPDFVVRAETIGDGEFPSSDIGFEGSRFGVDTSQLFPAPAARTPGKPRKDSGVVPPKIMLIDDVEVLPLEELFVPVDYGGAPCIHYLADANGMPCPVKSVDPDGVWVQVPAQVLSGPLVLFDVHDAKQASNDVTLVRQEAVAPFVVGMTPVPGGAVLDPGVTIEVVFSEVMRREPLVGSMRLFVTEGSRAEIEVPAVRALGSYKVSVMTIRPLFPFPLGAGVSVRFVAPVDDLAGNAMLPAPDLDFTIGT